MKIILERVIEAKITSAQTKDVIAFIQKGYIIHVSILEEDTTTNFEQTVKSILNMNLFEDQSQNQNQQPQNWKTNIVQNDLEILVVPSFSFKSKKNQEEATQIYDAFINCLRSQYKNEKIKFVGYQTKAIFHSLSDGITATIQDDNQSQDQHIMNAQKKQKNQQKNQEEKKEVQEQQQAEINFTDIIIPPELLKLQHDPNPEYNPQKSKLSLKERIKLIMSVGEECLGSEDLQKLLETKDFPVCYDGFEPSGRMHVAQGIFKVINVNKLADAGCIFIFWIADLFGKLNNKMGGDLEKIRIVGQYFIEIWKALGMKMSNVQFLWASDEINKKSEEYWLSVMDVATQNSLNRIKRCSQIMGRKENDDLSTAQMLYPCMQCTDIFFLNVDICQLGMDQRKVNVLAREYCDSQVKRLKDPIQKEKWKKKPIVLSHHLLIGLQQGQEKASKSLPDSAIYMDDSALDVERKIANAYCPWEKFANIKEFDSITQKEIERKVKVQNPILESFKYLIFQTHSEVSIEQPQNEGGTITYKTYDDLKQDYYLKFVNPKCLKTSLAKYMNKLIQPVRDHFEKDQRAKDILALVRKFQITR